jgi:hypothetical protein
MKLIISIVAVIALAGGAVGYGYWADWDKRVTSIEKFLDSMCLSGAVDASSRVNPAEVGRQLTEAHRSCAYGISSKAKSLAKLDNAELIDGLVHACVQYGGVDDGNRLMQQLKAIQGITMTDQSVCRDKVREAFPKL